MKRYAFCLLLMLIPLVPLTLGAAMVEDTASAWMDKGIRLEGEDKYPEAVKAFTRAIEIDKTLAEAYLERGKAIFIINRTHCLKSLKDFSTAIDLDPDNADFYYERALLNFYMLNNEAGRKDMERAAELGHASAREWLNPTTLEEKTCYVNVAGYTKSQTEPVVLFDYNKAVIKPPYRVFLDELGTALKETIPKTKVILAGHADSKGSEAYNVILSQRRAEAVRNYLGMHHRIPASRMILKAFGEARPVAPNDREDQRARNRRVEIIGFEVGMY